MLIVYSTKTCGWCKQLEKYLRIKKVEFQKVMVDEDRNKRQELFEKTGSLTVPIATNGSEYVVGYNLPLINSLINRV